jgi:hypothetical protein
VEEVGVVDGAMRAVGGEDGGTDVSSDLLRAECARSAATRSLLQRGGTAVPARVPAADGWPSALDCVAASESGKAASVVTCLVLEEDGMLGLSAEMRHRVVEGRVVQRRGRRERAAARLRNHSTADPLKQR